MSIRFSPGCECCGCFACAQGTNPDHVYLQIQGVQNGSSPCNDCHGANCIGMGVGIVPFRLPFASQESSINNACWWLWDTQENSNGYQNISLCGYDDVFLHAVLQGNVFGEWFWFAGFTPRLPRPVTWLQAISHQILTYVAGVHTPAYPSLVDCTRWKASLPSNIQHFGAANSMGCANSIIPDNLLGAGNCFLFTD